MKLLFQESINISYHCLLLLEECRNVAFKYPLYRLRDQLQGKRIARIKIDQSFPVPL